MSFHLPVLQVRSQETGGKFIFQLSQLNLSRMFFQGAVRTASTTLAGQPSPTACLENQS